MLIHKGAIKYRPCLKLFKSGHYRGKQKFNKNLL